MTAPRVVFVLVAYNQARWVRQACEAALNQDYSPLEILFSDDASTDDTFAIMQAVADDYRGPHRLRLNRNTQNLGLIHHVNHLHELADADLLVVAAGDDISLPTRTSALVQAFRAAAGRAYSFHSAVQTIDEQGQVTGLWRPPLTELQPDPAHWMTSMSTLIGASHAWTRELFTSFGPICQQGAYEDLVLAYRAMLLGGLQYLDTPLVQYRQNIGLASGPRGLSRYDRLMRSLNLKIAVFEQRRLDCLTVGRGDLATSLAETVAGLQLRRDILLKQCDLLTSLRTARQGGLVPTWLRAHAERVRYALFD